MLVGLSTFDFVRLRAQFAGDVRKTFKHSHPMYTEPTYHLTSYGCYVLVMDGEEQGPVLDEVAICYDREDGTLHKHGAPAAVMSWFDAARARLTQAGYPDLAEALVMAQGQFPLEDLNKMLHISGFAQRYFEARTSVCPT